MRRSSILAAAILLACCSCAFALNPSLDVSQYAHTAWKISEGFSKGAIWSMAQTPDGYLWLGTEFGLLRFDGIATVPWQPPVGEQLPSTDIRSLCVARDGRLWIGTYRGLVSWQDGKLAHYPKFDGLIVESLLEDREGTIWLVAGWTLSQAKLCSVRGATAQCFGEDGGAGSAVTSIYEDSSGNLWAGAMDGVWRWKPGPPTLYRSAAPAQRTFALVESDDGAILITRRDGISKLMNGKFEPFPPAAGLEFSAGKIFRDRDGGLWIGALGDQGLLHIHRGRIDRFTPAEGIFGDLSGDAVRCFFEDREGNVWVSTGSGLDRFREFAIPTFSVAQGLSSRGVMSVVAGKDGSIWIAVSDGLNRWNNGQITTYRSLQDARRQSAASAFSTVQMAEPGATVRKVFSNALPAGEVLSLFEDTEGQLWVATVSGLATLTGERFVPVKSVPAGNVLSIVGDQAGNVWVSHDQGLFHLHRRLLVERIPWANFGRKEPASALIQDARREGLWIGFREGGVAFFQNGQIRAAYGAAEGLGEGIVQGLYNDENGALWASTDGGLSRIQDGRVLTLTSQNGLPCNNVHWMKEDDAGSAWLYTACGLARIPRSELDAWVADPKLTIQPTVFDSFDGVRNHPGISGYSPIVAKSPDGRLWFVGTSGVSIIDPEHLPINKLPPPIHIEQLIVDGTTYGATNGLRLAPGVRDLMFDFTALSFVAPEKVRIRVKLEGQDNDWRDLINQRRVHYTNLSPRGYRFRVIACNNSGVCDEEGEYLDFSIAPAFYQRASFYVLCAVAFLLMVFTAYRLRVNHLARQFNRTLEARVSERTRIARDLHDTLLQSYQGLLLRFQSASKLLPERPVEAKGRLDKAIDQAAAAITEGRDAVQGLRSSAFETNDLANAITAMAQELTGAANTTDSPAIEVEVEGPSRNLNPVVRDEAYRIASEALRNALRHAQARRIVVEIAYAKRQFRLRVRDDGKGIEEATNRQQRRGHFGLPGMRERAEIVGGHLEVWSRLDSGTHIELSIPGSVAYKASRRNSEKSNQAAAGA